MREGDVRPRFKSTISSDERHRLRDGASFFRGMPHHGITLHISGTSLSAQARYVAGAREILECWFDKRPIRNEYLIVQDGKPAGTGAHSYSAGSEQAARFKTG
jgi:formate dehydrogenase